MELSQSLMFLLLGIVTLSLHVRSTSGESGFLVTAPQKFIIGSTERVCVTSFELSEHAIRITIGGAINVEVSEEITGEDMCLDIKIPYTDIRSSQVEARLQVEVTGRSSVSGEPFIESRDQKILLISAAEKIQTYVQTDKPIYKAGQTVKFRILSLSYPDLKPYIKKIRKVYVQEPGGRRVQQWSSVDTQSGLADMEMPLSPEPPLGNWTIFVVVHGSGGRKVQQIFEVGEYVLPKFSVTVQSHPSYIIQGTEMVNVKICGEYSYGEPVTGSIEANFTIRGILPWGRPRPRPVVSRSIDDTGSDGCHMFSIEAASLEVQQCFDESRSTEYQLNVEAAFTEQGTEVSMTETDNVASLERNKYTLVIEGPDSFKPGLPYHGMVRLNYPDNFPVSNKEVKVILTNFEGGEGFTERITVTVNNGVGDFVFTTPRNSENTKIKIEASVVQSDNPSRVINSVKYLQAWFSQSGSFLQVAPMPMTKQDGQQDNIDVDFTVPTSKQPIIRFHYKIMARGNVVKSGIQEWNAPSLPIAPLPRTHEAIDIHNREEKPPIDLSRVPIRNRAPVGPRAKRRSPPRQQLRPQIQPPRPHPGPSRPQPGSSTGVLEPSLPDYLTTDVTRVSIPITVTTMMAPKSRVIVYYIRSDGEVVSGSGQFSVANVFENQVSMDFSTQEAQPGAPMQLTVTAATQSLCAVGIVDKSVHLLRDSNQLTAKKVESPLQSFDTYSEHPINPSSRCSSSVQDGPSSLDRSYEITKFSKHLDTTEAFKNAGMVLITNLQVENRPCYIRRREITMYYHYMRRGGAFGAMGPRGNPGVPMAVPMAFSPVARNPMQMAPELDVDVLSRPDDEPEASLAPLVEIRSYFPETWIWHIETISETGSANISSEVPHTITDWVANGFCTSVESGFGIAEPVKLRAFQPFFLSYNLPYSAIREEKIPVVVTVFNYLTECFTVELSIEPSSDYSLLNASPIQYVCVCDRESKTINYTIIPRTLGDVKITVHGSYVAPGGSVPFCGNNVFLPTVEGVRDAIEDTLLVEPEGVEREETFSEMACVEEGDEFSAVVPLSLPKDVIQDSARGTVFVTGDLMGSVLSNLDSILRMPTGCGEQNMILFAPNIYVLQYLILTHQLTKEIEDKALEFLRIGYQRELTYRLNDASYSAFGQSDGVGSTWLTAFVLKSFVEANAFIDIDTDDIVKTRNWLLGMQNKQTGCFRNSGILRHKSMQGGVSDEVTLTAYVLVALLESGVEPDDSRVILAEECISARLTDSYDDPYALALVTYALLLAENPDGQVALQQLDAVARTENDGVKYWKRTDDEIITDDCHYCSPPSASVEMTSYALLAFLISEDKTIAESIPIVRWMNQQRSALGGYSSTQDTVMGLQSLSQYAGEVYRNDTNMAIDVSKSGEVFLRRIVVNAENKILLQRLDLDEVPTTLTFDARGKGCALIQAQLKYNIPAVRNIHREPFDITIEMSPPNDKQYCGSKTINTCIRYMGTRDSTSMAAVEFKMVTGYEVRMDALMMYLQKHGRQIGLKRVDPPKKGTPLVLYFDQFDNFQRCFEVEVKQNMFVEGAKPASIKVYDYYEPSVLSYKTYNTCPPKEEDQLEELIP